MKSILKPKFKKGFYYPILVTMILGLVLFTLSGCNKVEEDPVYVNEEYGFSIKFPESWSGEFEIQPYDYGLIISSEINNIDTLAYIHKYTNEEWEELNYGEDIPVPYQILEENSEFTISLIYPGDINYDLEDENSVKKYKEMIKDLQEENFIFESFESNDSSSTTDKYEGGDDEMREIYLAGGCFWGVDAYMSQIEGVVDTSVGYANGTKEDPTYEQVCTGRTGHVEATYVKYDENIVTLEEILNKFWNIINPTLLNRQGGDIGSQYRTGIYYTDKEDLEIINKTLKEQEEKYKDPIVTEIMPLEIYYRAEEYHQDYLEKNPGGYCHIDLNS